MVHWNRMLDGCTVDDEMWYHALMTMARLESEVRPDLQNQRPEEWCQATLTRATKRARVFQTLASPTCHCR